MGHIRVPHDLVKDPYPGGCRTTTIASKDWPRARPCRRAWARLLRTFPPDHPAWTLEAHYLALGLANWVLTLSPQRILLGGGCCANRISSVESGETWSSCLNGYVQATEVMRDIDNTWFRRSSEARQGSWGAGAGGARLHATGPRNDVASR